VLIEHPVNHDSESMWPIKGREEHSTLFNTTIFKDVTKDVPGERVYSDQCMWQVLRRANPRSDPSVATLDVTSSTMGMDSSSTTVRIVVLCRECVSTLPSSYLI